VSSDGQAAAPSESPRSAPAAGGTPPPSVAPDFAAPAASVQQRPEVMIGAAFVGGLAAALLLRRLGGR
jgi:hypothetical protein